MPDVDSKLIMTLDLDAERLEALFGNETCYGIVEPDSGDGALFPDGRRWSTCTSWANYVCRVLADRAIGLGFGVEENPTSKVAEYYDGHDFALVDDRFIVDGWVREVAGMSDRIVFDLRDTAQAEEILKLYGDRAAWGPSGEDPRHESAYQRQRAMASSRFQEIIDSFAPTPSLA